MRRVVVGTPPPDMMKSVEGRWISSALKEIELASFENDTSVITKTYLLENYTETRALDVATATTADIANVLATLILDLKRGGSKKG